MKKLTLILGGARSGKSTYAERLVKERGQRVLYIATAEALDPEMAARIEKHKAQRPGSWQTMEIPTGVANALRNSPIQVDLILLDCLTMLISNVVLSAGGSVDEPDETRAARAVDSELESLMAVIQQSDANWIIVSNEVGMGLVPPYPLGRYYRDLLGRANQRLAAQADEVYLLVAGIPIPLHHWRADLG